MTTTDLFILLPFVILTAGIVSIMLTIAFYRNHLLTLVLTLVTLCLCFASLPLVSSADSPHVTSLLIVDGYALFFIGLLLAAAIVIAILSYGYLENRLIINEEFYIFLLIATLGCCVLVSSSHLASFFLALEILSISLYALIAYPKLIPNHIEAAIKYLILAGVSTAFLLFGMALIYAQLGTMHLSLIMLMLAKIPDLYNPFFLAAVIMILIGIGFKLAFVPLHLWAPDIYEGAPAPVTAFIAASSKGAVFALLLRYFTVLDIHHYMPLFIIFSIIAVSSMFFGNLLALLQNNIKRILAYSSIAHLGYLLVAFLASGSLAVVAVTFYIVSYFAATLGAFGVITVLSGKITDLDKIEDYRGLAFNHPALAAVFTASLFSLAGIPLTAGFIGKFYLLSAGVSSSLWLLIIILIINSSIGLFYYLRIIFTLYSKPLEPLSEFLSADSQFLLTSYRQASGLVLALLTLLILWLGIYPNHVINLIKTVANSIY